jgi:hypothetical protein
VLGAVFALKGKYKRGHSKNNISRQKLINLKIIDLFGKIYTQNPVAQADNGLYIV